MLQILSVPPQKSANNKSPTGAGVLIDFFLLISLVRLNIPTLCGHQSWFSQCDRSLLSTDVFFYLSTAAPQDTFSLLKPSTLKQLGHSVPASAAKQVSGTCGEA